MALVAVDGAFLVPIGPAYLGPVGGAPNASPTTLDAANEALIMIGHIVTSDGGSHTINTTGSSSIGWQTGTVTFSNAGTTVKVGLAAVSTTAGPPGRAANTTDVITFDVSKSLTGGGGGITTDAWQTHVPDTGSKTIAHGDLVAMCVQMTARGGSDSVIANAFAGTSSTQRPICTTFTGGAYASLGATPNTIITFSDGAFGYFFASDVFSTINTRTWNSGGATKEYGQLYKLPFPVKVYGLFGYISTAFDFDAVLYSDPLGSPVAEKTTSVVAATIAIASARRFTVMFSSPYTTSASQNIAAVLKPGASNISSYYKTLASATHRVADIWGTNGYGISRASGAFANANSSLDHYYLGLLVGAFDAGGAAGRSVKVNDVSLVG